MKRANPLFIPELRRLAEAVQLVAIVCTGSFLLVRTGLPVIQPGGLKEISRGWHPRRTVFPEHPPRQGRGCLPKRGDDLDSPAIG